MSTDVVKAPLRPGRNARGKWDMGAPHGISHISSSNPPLGGGHGRNFANDPVENEGANRFSVSAEVDRSWSATQRLQSMGSKRGGPTEQLSMHPQRPKPAAGIRLGAHCTKLGIVGPMCVSAFTRNITVSSA